ncbi:hypothetical protein [Gordonia oryzae]|uniref:hypothetical protein n=1 Tax=Gordonia oryzae TaxID=2487349 RepID=UPI003F8360C2
MPIQRDATTANPKHPAMTADRQARRRSGRASGLDDRLVDRRRWSWAVLCEPTVGAVGIGSPVCTFLGVGNEAAIIEELGPEHSPEPM